MYRYICRDRWHITGDDFQTRALNNTRERKTWIDVVYREREREEYGGTHTPWQRHRLHLRVW